MIRMVVRSIYLFVKCYKTIQKLCENRHVSSADFVADLLRAVCYNIFDKKKGDGNVLEYC
jgi:hypothetical protein